MLNDTCYRIVSGLAVSLLVSTASSGVQWTDWQSFDSSSAVGDLGGIEVTFSGSLRTTLPGNQSLEGITTSGDTDVNNDTLINAADNVWVPSTAKFLAHPDIDSIPTLSDGALSLASPSQQYTFNFASEVIDPVFLIQGSEFGGQFLQVLAPFPPTFGTFSGDMAQFSSDRVRNLGSFNNAGAFQFIGSFTEVRFFLLQDGQNDGVAITVGAVPSPGSAALALVAAGLVGTRRRRD